MKRLLILGSLGEFTRLVQKARARGIYTIVCDGYPHGPARQYADASYTLDLYVGFIPSTTRGLGNRYVGGIAPKLIERAKAA